MNLDKVSPCPWAYQGQTFYSNWLDMVSADKAGADEQVNRNIPDKTRYSLRTTRVKEKYGKLCA